jgi:hypothetical protein
VSRWGQLRTVVALQRLVHCQIAAGRTASRLASVRSVSAWPGLAWCAAARARANALRPRVFELQDFQEAVRAAARDPALPRARGTSHSSTHISSSPCSRGARAAAAPPPSSTRPCGAWWSQMAWRSAAQHQRGTGGSHGRRAPRGWRVTERCGQRRTFLLIHMNIAAPCGSALWDPLVENRNGGQQK